MGLDILLVAILAFAPLFFGGRYDGGKLVVVALIVVAMCVCAVRVAIDRTQRWHGCRALWLVAVGVLLLGLQLWPNSHPTASAAKLLPVWSTTTLPVSSNAPPASTVAAKPVTTIGSWTQQSFAPAQTRAGLVMLLAYAGLFVVVVQRTRTISDVEQVLTLIGWTAVGMAAFGLIQYLTSNGNFVWIYEHPWRNTAHAVKGPFDNQNHFVHFLALGCGPLMWWWLRHANKQGAQRLDSTNRDQPRDVATSPRVLIGGFAIGVVLFAALMSFSRAGCLLILLVVGMATIAYYRLGWIRRQLAVALVGVASLVVVALWIHGSDRLTTRLNDYTSASVETLDRGHARRKVWTANIEAIRQNGVIGAGVGSHRYLCPVYLKDSPPTEHTHAESGYLQVLLETGWPGLLLLLGGISIIGGWVAFGDSARAVSQDKLLRNRACMIAVATGLIASVLHSFVDFVWYIPACMSLAVILAACAFRLQSLSAQSRDDSNRGLDLPPAARWALVGLTVCVGAAMVLDRVGPAIASPAWDNYLREQKNLQDGNSDTSAASRGIDSPVETSLDSQIDSLKYVVRWNPNHARAHLRLAGVYLQKFQLVLRDSDNALDVSQLRDAVIRTNFAALARRTIAEHDRNTNGTLEKDEVVHQPGLLKHWGAADTNGNTRLDPVELASLLRDQWLKRTMQFFVKASEVLKQFDTDRDQVLAGDELAAAQAASQALAMVRRADDTQLTTDDIAESFRHRYRDSWRYLHSALSHAKQGLSACPLQGEGYLLLAELCFLDDQFTLPSDFASGKRHFVNQALRLRPSDGNVLLVAGKEAVLSNHLELATALWRRSFQSGRAHRERLIDLFVQQQIPIDFVAHQFALVLDAQSCDIISRRYETAGIATESTTFWAHFARTAEAEAEQQHGSGSASVNAWLLAHKAYGRLNDSQAQLRCARAAAAFEPNDYRTRLSLARIMVDQQLYAEAEPHLRWCLRRKPNDRYLRTAITKILDAASGGRRRTESIGKKSDRQPTRRQ